MSTARRQAIFALPEGGEAVLIFPTPLSHETLDMLADLSALLFRGLKRDADAVEAKKAGDAEYESWQP